MGQGVVKTEVPYRPYHLMSNTLLLAIDPVDYAWLQSLARSSHRSVEEEAAFAVHTALERIADEALDLQWERGQQPLIGPGRE